MPTGSRSGHPTSDISPMLLNFLRLAVRAMRRHPAYALINIFGLGLGLFASFMVLLWVQDELSFDRFHEDSEQVFQVMRTSVNGGNVS
ncbi:MAG: putative ABC transport system permease protein, partial [Rhodothermales bacterium]